MHYSTSTTPARDPSRIETDLPYIWQDGLCEVCGKLLNPNTFIKQGARMYCSFSCSDVHSEIEERSISRVNHATNECRKEVEQFVAFRKLGSKTEMPKPESNYGQYLNSVNTPAKKEKSEISLSEDVKTNLECLDARSMIERYIQNVNQIEHLDNTMSDMRSQLYAVKEPEVIEDISIWNQYRHEKAAMAELARKTETESTSSQVELREQNKYLSELMCKSEEIPNAKWIRSGDMAIYVPPNTDFYVATVKPWSEVLKEKKSIEKRNSKTGVSNRGLEVIGGLVLLAGLVIPAVFIGMYVGIVAVSVWIIVYTAGAVALGVE